MLATLLDAEIVAVGPEGERSIPASEFFHGFFMTALEPDEMIVEIRFPQPAPHAALQEFARRAGDYGIVAAAVALDVEGGECRSARVVLGGVSDVPLRIPEAEKVLEGTDIGRDDTIFAIREGTVEFRTSGEKRFISVAETDTDQS